MRISTIAAFAAAILLASPAAAQADYAAREARARSLLGPLISEIGLAEMQELRGVFRGNGFTAEEQVALERAFDAEIPGFVQFMQDKMIASAARHVPIEQIREDADFDSPEWTAAGDEVTVWGRRGALDLVIRVTQQGCAVRPAPSEQCKTVMQRARDDLAALGPEPVPTP